MKAEPRARANVVSFDVSVHVETAAKRINNQSLDQREIT